MDAEAELALEAVKRFSVAKIAVPMAMIVIGGIVLVIALLCLIIRAIGKKKLKGTLITLAVCVAVVLGGIFAGQYFLMDFMGVYADVVREHNIASYTGETDAISFTTTDKDGAPVDSSIFADAKVTLVNRWEPWCGPCKAEMPAIEALYQQYKASGLNVIGIYSEEEGLQEALDETGVSYPILHDAEGFTYLNLGGSVPQTVFVDSEGKILDIPEQYRTSAVFDGAVTVVSEDYDRQVITGGRDAEAFEAMILSYLG